MFRRARLTALLLAASGCLELVQPVLAAPGEGSVNRAERRQKALQKFDQNGNGQLDPDEKEAAKQALQNRLKQRGGGKGPGGKAGDNPERRRLFMEKFDTDGDGKLSEAERAAAKEARGARGR